MSTKINARSPFFIEATEPALALGLFTCTTANLLNFAVSSAGDVTEPSILKGTIIDRTATSFAANTSGSAISRSVTYTIKIPTGYSNTSDGTLNCVKTVNQPTQTPAEDPPQNPNCPTFAGTIPAITNLTSTTVNLATYFTAGSGATISGYSVQNYGAASITTSVSGNTLTISTSNTCAATTLRVTAFNVSDACTAVSNTFSVSAACSKTLTCTITDANNDAVSLQGGSISDTGSIKYPSYVIAHLDHIEDSDNNTITSVPANTTGSPKNVTLTFVFDVPDGYTNSGQELECDKLFVQQPTTAPLINLTCSDPTLSFSGFSITSEGNLIAGTVNYLGSPNTAPTNMTTEDGSFKYDLVASSTSRTVSITFKVLNVIWLNNNTSITCTLALTQPAQANACNSITGDYAISEQSFTAPNSFCDFNKRYSILQQVNGSISVGSTVCYLGNPFDGGSKFFAYNTAQSQNGAGNIGTSFGVMQIDSNGTILRITTTNCQGDTGDDIQF